MPGSAGSGRHREQPLGEAQNRRQDPDGDQRLSHAGREAGREPSPVRASIAGQSLEPAVHLAEAVVRMKGEAIVVPTQRMPSDTGVAAIYRF